MITYIGNKSKWRVEHKTTVIADLFMGSGGWTRSALATNPNAAVIGAEKNPNLRHVLLQTLEYQQAIVLAKKISDDLKATIPDNWDGTGSFSVIYPQASDELKRVWAEKVKQPYNVSLFQNCVSPDSIAAYLMLTTYAYGGVVRTSKNGVNSPPNPQKIKELAVTLPKPLAIQDLQADFRDVPLTPSCLVLIDPPYWFPERMKKNNRLRPSYPGHLPFSLEGFENYRLALERAVKAYAHTIVVAGYWSEELNRLIKNVAWNHEYNLRFTCHGKKQMLVVKHACNFCFAPLEFEWTLIKL